MLTRSGLGAAIVAVVGIMMGWGLRYEELIAAGAAIAALVAMAVIGTQRAEPPAIERRLTTPRVQRLDPIRLNYRVENLRRRRTPKFALVDVLDDQRSRLEIAPVPPRQRREFEAGIDTTRRGHFIVGPCRAERSDPFGLAVGQREVADGVDVTVHPRVYRLDGPRGAMHSTDEDAYVRTATGDPINGFVSLRSYVDGDDPRLIHWPTTARIGSLMLRETVEFRRPEFTIVVDTALDSANATDFEEIVDVAASLAVDALIKGIDVRLRTTDREQLGPVRSIRSDVQVLEFLTPVCQTPPERTAALVELFQRGGATGRVVIVTGPRRPSDQFHDVQRGTVVRIGADATSAPGIYLAATDAAEFSSRWRP